MTTTLPRPSTTAPDNEAGSRWRGGVVFSPGLMAFTGRIGDANAHAHAAVQVLFVARGRLTLTDSGGRTTIADTAIIPPGVGHEVHADADTSGFVAFPDPDSTTAHAALSRLAGMPADQATSWVTAATPRRPTHPLGPLPPGQHRRSHPVVADALRIAGSYLGGPPTLVELAARVGISASRRSHVFTAEVGLPYAGWRRWTGEEEELLRVLQREQPSDRVEMRNPGHILDALAAGGSRARDDQLANELRFVLSNRLGDHAAHGEAEEVDLGKTQRADEGDGILRHRLNGVRRRAGGRADAAESTHSSASPTAGVHRHADRHRWLRHTTGCARVPAQPHRISADRNRG